MGVQPQRIERIAELLASVTSRGSAQLIVTTHSPDFVAAMLDPERAEGQEIGLFSVVREGRATSVRPLDFSAALWQERALDELLTDPDPYDKMASLVRRGWLHL